MSWLFESREVDTLPEDCVGFVYMITNQLDGRQYIGKKLAKFATTKYRMVTLKNGKKKQRRVRGHVDSDWKTYYGSSPELQRDVMALGAENFHREILFFCKSKSECSYIEAREQFSRKVLESDQYYNQYIQVRVHGKQIKGKLD